MTSFSQTVATLNRAKLQAWLTSPQLHQLHQQTVEKHGKWPLWSEALAALPETTPQLIELDAINAIIKAGNPDVLSKTQTQSLWATLQTFQPWRKGPFEICGLVIDSEWQSNMKWDRFIHAIQPLENRVILDVGCGNGYFSLRMLAQGAQLVVGIDPFPLYVAQFMAIQHFTGQQAVDVLAIRMEDLPHRIEAFDSVFSMGVLYHRRSAFDHLIELRDCLRPGGELVLETIVIDGPQGMTLLPKQRYASMHNVWLLPSCLTLENWLQRCGFCDIELIDISPTTTVEQRTTASMTFKSLADFLDPDNPELTIEGYPAPQRAIFIAHKK
ncbi:MAG TPA: tRNA 5-methoxyuridine(34)/uridine 5-oxyacetic acid(34) synthase CmoB [Crenotrichaceae bacterium]|nr:tRNA 5-methoxyuridine(34)/uridine 5-oxyacetic acid(34) synthase CmoB [Crenotrichaceae bacterium]